MSSIPQSMKASVSIETNDSGRYNVPEKPLHPSNAPLLMYLIVLGSDKVPVRSLQSSKALSPMAVTVNVIPLYSMLEGMLRGPEMSYPSMG